MANTKQAKKRARQDVVRNEHNTALRTRYRTAIKNVRVAVSSGDESAAWKALSSTFSVLDTVAKKHIIHRNKAARYKSRLHLKVKSMASV